MGSVCAKAALWGTERQGRACKSLWAPSPLAAPLLNWHPAAAALALQLRVAVRAEHAALGQRVDVVAAGPHAAHHVGLRGSHAAQAALAPARVLAHLARAWQGA